MKIDKDEFCKKLWKKYPNSWIETHYWGTQEYLFFTHDPLDPNLSKVEMINRSACTWLDGHVIKDLTNTFLSPPSSFITGSGTYTFTIPTIPGQKVYIEMFGGCSSGSDSPKCCCGAHSVGSNRHSSYCDIKGEA